ncbi:WD40 domain protein [Rhizoctonia solani 123E]|uniref:WD40 domain protein n=1 Tax=Rhizoctonia solani 123E TaxID=1423351 RepID=A0A074RJQ8_9AGAM|nr:WD40 domain protein [Rhizoctonia solani 123E]
MLLHSTTTMTLPTVVQSRLSNLETRFSECRDKFARLRSAERDEEHDRLRHDEFIPIFNDACALVREAELAGAPYLLELAKSTGAILNNQLRYALDTGDDEHLGVVVGLFDMMPSWAHDDVGDRPVITDLSGRQLPFPPSALEKFIEVFKPLFAEGVTGDFIKNEYRNDPWDPSMKPHPKSTRMARFRPNLPTLTPTLGNSLAASILDARCEVFSAPCAYPIRFCISPSCLALTGTAGYKNRSPYLEYIILTKPLDPMVDFPDEYTVEPGLAGVAYHAAIDDARRLIFVGDNDRVKSYEWGSTEEVHDEPLPVHTLDSRSAKGPMIVLPNGSLARAGKGGASIFDIQALPTHGPDGDAIIGKVIQIFDTWRDEEDEIERSSGSLPSSRIKFFDDPNFEPNLWEPLISAPSTVLCSEKARRSGVYDCVGIDLETGKTVSYHLGHGDEITAFSVAPSDPQLFLTACGDGFARLFDLRHPLPVVTVDACGLKESCEAATLVMPGGIPTVFTGTSKSEQIKLWDIRARACVYELSTGNTMVESLSWDAHNNCLYAATQCSYMDRLGNHHDYRYARIPKSQRSIQGVDEEDEEDEDDEDDEAATDGERCWPKDAWHTEDYFGHLFDAGDHSIIRYKFKEDPISSVVPLYGNATVGGGHWPW